MQHIVPRIQICNGVTMPIVGFGTWLCKDDELRAALNEALEAGYRHIDTAAAYGNERVIGEVLHEWFSSGKLKREEIFITTKVPPRGNYPEGVAKYLQLSLEDLQLNYVDLYLIHVPMQVKDEDSTESVVDVSTDLVANWKAMEAQLQQGKTRSIGVSNFNRAQIERILTSCNVRPANLQIEIHPYLQQDFLIGYCHSRGLSVTAYSPLGAPGLDKLLSLIGQVAELPKVLENSVVVDIAQKHEKSPAQISLRYGIQRGLVVIPKSANPQRIRENLDVFGFRLSNDDMTRLSGLDCGFRAVTFNFIPGIEKHPEFPF